MRCCHILGTIVYVVIAHDAYYFQLRANGEDVATSKRVAGERIAILSFTMVLIGAVLLVFGLSFVPSLIGELVIAVGMGMGNAAVFKLVAKYVPEAVGGEAGWSRGFIVYIVLAVMCIAIALILRKRFGAQEA